MAHTNVSPILPARDLTDADFGTFGNNAATLLSSDITAAQLTIPVDKLDDFPDIGIIYLGGERILYTSKSASTGTGNLIVPSSTERGYDGSAAASHVKGSRVALIISAYTLNRAIQEIRILGEYVTGTRGFTTVKGPGGDGVVFAGDLGHMVLMFRRWGLWV